MVFVSSKTSHKILASTKSSNFGHAIRFMTNRSTCMIFLLFVCTVSMLVSITQFEINKQIKARSYPLVLNPNSLKLMQGRSKENWIREKHPFQISHKTLHPLKNVTNKRSYHVDLKSTQVASSTADLVKKSLKSKENETAVKKTQGQILQINPKNTEILEQSQVINPASHESQKQLAISSSEKEFAEAAENSTNVDDRGREDYVRNPEPEENGYYTETDPAREKLVYSAIRYVNRKRLHPYYKQTAPLLPEQTKGVILLTNYRSGSTFLGELFNQHPEAFYIFEPLFPFSGGCDHDQVEVKNSVIEKLLKCDFPNMAEVYRQVKGPLRKSSVDMKCLVQDLCFRKNTKELCVPEMCPSMKKTRSCRSCGPLHIPKAQNACREKKLTVIKAIRICDILNLKRLLTDPKMDIKIVHLVRDPRGIESSRIKINLNWKLKKNADTLCSHMLHNGKSAVLNNSLPWLKGRYMKIRYENLSLEPTKFAAKIYEFVGLDLIPSVKHWISANTKSRSSSNPYSTTRDSAKAMQAWRTHLNMSQLMTIQDSCSETMSFYGYKKVSNEKELRNLDTFLFT